MNRLDNHRLKQPARPVTTLAGFCGGPDPGPGSTSRLRKYPLPTATLSIWPPTALQCRG